MSRRRLLLIALFLSLALHFALLGALLFGVAGTLDWPGAWLFLGVMAALAPCRNT